MAEKTSKEVRISARVNQRLKEKFVERAKALELTETEAIKLLVEKFILGGIEIDPEDSDRVERLEKEMQLLKSKLEQMEKSREGEYSALAIR